MMSQHLGLAVLGFVFAQETAWSVRVDDVKADESKDNDAEFRLYDEGYDYSDQPALTELGAGTATLGKDPESVVEKELVEMEKSMPREAETVDAQKKTNDPASEPQPAVSASKATMAAASLGEDNMAISEKQLPDLEGSSRRGGESSQAELDKGSLSKSEVASASGQDDTNAQVAREIAEIEAHLSSSAGDARDGKETAKAPPASLMQVSQIPDATTSAEVTSNTQAELSDDSDTHLSKDAVSKMVDDVPAPDFGEAALTTPGSTDAKTAHGRFDADKAFADFAAQADAASGTPLTAPESAKDAAASPKLLQGTGLDAAFDWAVPSAEAALAIDSAQQLHLESGPQASAAATDLGGHSLSENVGTPRVAGPQDGTKAAAKLLKPDWSPGWAWLPAVLLGTPG